MHVFLNKINVCNHAESRKIQAEKNQRINKLILFFFRDCLHRF